MHMHKRISERFTTVIVPGVTSVSAASAALAMPLAEGDDVLTVLPGTLGRDELTRRLRDPGAAAIMKIGRSFAAVREALKDSGRLDDAYYVERASAATRQVIERAGAVDPATVPYMSLLIIAGPQASGQPEAPGVTAPASARATAGRPAAERAPASAGAALSGTDSWPPPLAPPRPPAGRVDVVGLGPAGRDWLTPQAAAVLAAADDIVGYEPYVARVPRNPRQQRHGSDNRVEAQRAELALDLALRGRRVAVVSSGDPGVFAMASPVLEAAASDGRFAGVAVGIVPGITAAQAVASIAGAPLGHDYVMLSLSDRLKPWEVIARRLAAAAEGDFAIAIYNPASQSRRQQLIDARDLLLTCRDAATPVVIGRAVGTGEQQVTVTTLGELDPAQVDMRCLLIIGSSQSRVVRDASGAARVITPRRYPG
jgi:precorrin-2 C20-methyltransferase/precorrin-3B C17-methyltransferase